MIGAATLERVWQERRWSSHLLLPLAALYRVVAALRRRGYAAGWFPVQRLDVPVIVVGNITVGGTGKTPLAIWLSGWLKQRGWRPGIVSRGYGGRSRRWPRQVTGESDPAEVGDEPVVISRRTRSPVWVGPDRAAAARALVRENACDIIVSDDGLQHYSLGRDLEIAVVDGERRIGNGRLLPAGPLREPVERLRQVDAVVVNGDGAGAGEFSMRTIISVAVSLIDPDRRVMLDSLGGRRVHVVTGTGNPRRFIDQLRGRGMEVSERLFPDHHSFHSVDLEFTDDDPVLMTEKDAVKCQPFATDACWFVPADVEVDPRFTRWLGDRTGALRSSAAGAQ